jgi:prepilin-type N-terminal cleavage/methylation domain-containing protein
MSGPSPFRAPAPGRPRRIRFRRHAGFTVVELLTVMVIISILTAITMSISKFIHTREDTSKALGEMDLIVTALEEFKADYGDYPPMDNDDGSQSPYAEQNLLMALTGHARWTQDSFGNPLWETVSMSKKLNDGSAVTPGPGEKYTWGKAYVQLSQLTVDVDPNTESGIKDGAVIHDPWWQSGDPKDSAYLYRYKMRADKVTPASMTWQSTTFLLVSRGPDGLPEDPESNFIWKPVNKKTAYSGILADNYSDPASNPPLADNLVRGSVNLPPP